MRHTGAVREQPSIVIDPQRQRTIGLVHGLASYGLWALFPLFFRLLDHTDAFGVVAHRIVWSLVVGIILIAATRRWADVVSVLRRPRTLLVMVLAGVLVSANWTIWVWGVNNGHALDGALGYFINPLFSAFLGVVILSERLRRAQWFAFAIGTIAVIVLVVGYGAVPWVAFGLTVSWGFYGLVKKMISGVTPLAGVTLETAAVLPIALGYLLWFAPPPGPDSTPLWLLMTAGPVTIAPLLLFASAANKLPLSSVAILQYIAPMGQFVIAWLVFGEAMPLARWIGFGLIWVALMIFALDGWAHRPARTLAQRPAG